MKLLDLIQGSPEWHAHRREHFNASDAPAMLGCSPYKTRAALLAECATGIAEEVDEARESLFAEGHRAERLARPLAEKIAGEEFYPVTGSEGQLSASFDGLTLSEETALEHKMLNGDLRACMVDGCVGADLPLLYQVQMEQQCMVSGAARVLFMATSWKGDTLTEERHCWYTPNPELAARIRGGWAQFADDLASYTPPDPDVPKAIAATIQALPALVVSVEGRVLNSNLAAFRAAATGFLAQIKTDLQTDQDFADAERTVGFCEDGEKRLELVKAQALAQTASIDELFRTVDAIREEMRAKRLQLDKLVTARKATIRAEIIANAQAELDAHVVKLNGRLGAALIPRLAGNFAEAMKGKKTVATLRDAANGALANSKIDTNALADRLDANRKSLVREGKDWFFLFADFAHVGNAPEETFAAVAAQRIQKHEAEVAAAAARATAAAVTVPAAPVAIAAPAPSPAAPALAVVGGRPARPGAVIATGAVCERLGFTVTAAFLMGLGLGAAPAPERKAGTWWHEADFPLICDALVRHIQQRAAASKVAA